MTESELRPGEVTIAEPAPSGAALHFIGILRTPWTRPAACPRRGDARDGPICRVEVGPPWRDALLGLEGLAEVELLYWMHLARRDLVVQVPRASGRPHGTFALRSPMRPNPIGASIVTLLGIEPEGLLVRGLDCVDGTPLIDIKPPRCPLWPKPEGPAHS